MPKRTEPPRAQPPAAAPGDRPVARAIEGWFAGAARQLPWRQPPAPPRGPARGGSPAPRRNPYHALVAEAMLQQTQVARAEAYFRRFVERFPTVKSLAAAAEAEVLALWAGLGYYRRARHLLAAARAVVERHAGTVPHRVDDLRALPGVGRYTAGAIASIAYGQAEPIVDGNVARVLLRLGGVDLEPAAAATQAHIWSRAAALVGEAHDPGAFNEGLMELGATVCTPAAPRCPACPVAAWCAARRLGLQEEIPRPTRKGPLKDIFCVSLLAVDANRRVLLERRPESGLWAGLWQAPTLESAANWPARADIADFARLRGLDPPGRGGPIAEFAWTTSHRRLHFRVLAASPGACLRKAAGRRWSMPADLPKLGISNAQRRVLESAGWPAASAEPSTAPRTG